MGFASLYPSYDQAALPASLGRKFSSQQARLDRRFSICGRDF
jgi:hypothetical protein